MVVNDSGLDLQAQIPGNVEYRELRIHIGIDHREGIDADHHEETQVAPAAVLVAALLEDVLIVLGILRGDLRAEVQELVIALRTRVIVHEVQIGLGVVHIHAVVPTHRIDTAHEPSIDQWQLPVFAIVNLSAAGDDQCQPQGPFGVGRKLGAELVWLVVRHRLIHHLHQTVGSLCECAVGLQYECTVGTQREQAVSNRLRLGDALADTRQKQEEACEGSPYRCEYLVSQRLTFHLVDDVHDPFQFVFIGKGNTDLSLALGGARHLYLYFEEL